MKSRVGPGALAFHYILSGGLLWLTFKFLWKDAGILFLAFLVVGAAWLLAAVYYTFERLQYGEVELDVDGPVHPGGKLLALLRAPAGFGDTRRLSATLQCKRVFWHDGLAGNRRNLTYGEEVVWSREARFPVSVRPGNSECRIEFDLPADARTTVAVGLVLGSERMHVQNWQESGFHWQLEVHAEALGIDLVRSFPVTVSARPPGKMAA